MKKGKKVKIISMEKLTAIALILLVSFLTLFYNSAPTQVLAAVIPINETNFPDALFREIIKTRIAGGGNILTDDMQLNTTYISVLFGDPQSFGLPAVSSIQGIEYFPNLEDLRLFGTKIESLDLTGNPNLLYFLMDANSGVTELDIDFTGNQNLKTITISRAPNLSTIIGLENMSDLYSFDISTCRIFKGSGTGALDFSQNPNLKTCRVYGMTGPQGSYQVTSVNVSQCPLLEKLDLRNCQLTNLDISNNPNLTYLDCNGNKLSTIDVSNKDHLVHLDLGNNKQMQSVNVANNLQLTYLRCSGNNISTLNVFGNTLLKELHCGDNKISTLDISNNLSLEKLTFGGNSGITEIAVNSHTGLTELNCSGTGISSLNIGALNSLQYLYCNNTPLTFLDVSNNLLLKVLNAQNSQLTGLYLGNHSEILPSWSWGVPLRLQKQKPATPLDGYLANGKICFNLGGLLGVTNPADITNISKYVNDGPSNSNYFVTEPMPGSFHYDPVTGVMSLAIPDYVPTIAYEYKHHNTKREDPMTVRLHLNCPNLSYITLDPDNGTSETPIITPIVTNTVYLLPENSFQAPTNKEFKGWLVPGESDIKQPSEQITVTEDITITATWDYIKHNVVLQPNNTVVPTPASIIVSRDQGSLYTVPSCPESFGDPDGQVFDETQGWYVVEDDEYKKPGESILINAPRTLQAQWKDQSYNVIYNDGGGSLNFEVGYLADPSFTVAKNGYHILLPANVYNPPTHRVFIGWNVQKTADPPGGATYQPTESVDNITADMTITAVWEEKNYTVTYDANNSTGTIYEVSVLKDTSHSLLEITNSDLSSFTAPADKGFRCWEINGGNQNPGYSFAVTGDITVKAVWDHLYEVTYKHGGGSGGDKTDTLVRNTPAWNNYQLKAADTFGAPANKEFKGWESDGWTGRKAANTSFTVNSSMEITAAWDFIQHNIRLEANNIQLTPSYKDIAWNQGSEYTLPNPLDEFGDPLGEVFTHWFITPDNITRDANEKVLIDEPKTITAIWEEKKYNITYNANGGTPGTGAPTGPIEVVKNGNHTLLAEDVYTPPLHKVFAGWNVVAAGNPPGDSVTHAAEAELLNITEGKTVTAIWVEKNYTVTYKANNGTGATHEVSVLKDTDHSLLEITDSDLVDKNFTAPIGEGFNSWIINGESRAPGYLLNVTGDVTVEAGWGTLYNVTYRPNGGTPDVDQSFSVLKGNYNLLQNTFFTAPIGYEFKAWNVGGTEKQPADSILVESDTDATAVWKKLVYTITLDPDNGGLSNIETEDKEWGDTYSLPLNSFEAPAGKGFKAWLGAATRL